MKALLRSLVVLVLTLWAQALFAEPSGAERALAERLFDEGRELMLKDRYGEACPKLEESQRIDPAGGTLLNLALCHERVGRVATAWSEFREALANARRDKRPDRESIALDHAKNLERALPRLELRLAEPTPELELTIDRALVRAEARSAPIPLDPGEHAIEARAPGKQAFLATVAIAAGETKTLEIPPLVRLPEAPLPLAVPTASTPKAAPPAPPPKARPADDGSTQRTVGYTVVGAGVVGLVVGVVFGLNALSEDEKSDAVCKQEGCSDPAGVEHSEKARRSALVSNIAFGSGAVALGAGTYLVLSSGPSAAGSESGGKRPSARFGAALVGSF